MKKTGMFLAVILVASLFASGLALAETSLSLTGKAIGLEDSDASVSATELIPSLSSSDVEESIFNVDKSIGKKQAYPGQTTTANGWIATDDKRTAFVHGIWTERKTSDGEIVSFGKLRIGKNTYKLEKTGEWTGKSLFFMVHEPNGEYGKLSLELTNQIGNMKFWEGTVSLIDGTKGDLTMASKTHRVKKLTKPELTAESGFNGIAKKPTINSVDDSGKLGISASDGKPAETEKKGFWKRFRDFFNRK